MKNPTTTMFLHQNVILNNKPYTYNQATGTYQEANIRLQFQPLQYVQYQQQFYVQPQQVFYNNTKPLQYVQYQQQVVYVQPPQVFYSNPPQVFYSNPPQQVAYNYLPTKFVYNNVHAQNLQNDPQQQQTFHNHLPTKLSESIYIAEKEAERIMRDLDKKFPKNQQEPVVKEAFNDKEGNDFIFPGARLVESRYFTAGNDIHSIAKNFKTIDNRTSESTRLSLEAPSSKFNISPLNKILQLVNPFNCCLGR